MIKTYTWEYKFTLINTSFNKSIQFTLRKKWHNHTHLQEMYSFCDLKACYGNKEQEDFRNKIDNTKQMIPFNGEKDNYFVTLQPGAEQYLIKKAAEDRPADVWEDGCKV